MAQNFFVDEPKKKEDVPNFFIDIKSDENKPTSITKETSKIVNKGPDQFFATPQEPDPTSPAERESFLSKAYNKPGELGRKDEQAIGIDTNAIDNWIADKASKLPSFLQKPTAFGASALANIASGLIEGASDPTSIATGFLGSLKSKLPKVAESAISKLPKENIQFSKPKLRINPDNTFTNTETGEIIDQAGKSIAPPQNLPKERPSGPWDKNIPLESTKIEDKLFQNVANKFGMAQDLPKAEFLALQENGEPLFNVIGGPKDKSTVSAQGLKELGLATPEIPVGSKPMKGSELRDLVLKQRSERPMFNPRKTTGMTGNLQNDEPIVFHEKPEFPSGKVKDRLYELIDKEKSGTLTDEELKEAQKLNKLLRNNDVSPIDPNTGDIINKPPNKLPSGSGGSGGGNGEPPIGPIVDRKQNSLTKEILNLPRGIMASYDLSAPGRQGLPLIGHKAWWTSWGDMVKSMGSEQAFKDVQNSIASKPLFKDYGSGSFANRAGLHLTDLTNLSNREEQLMSTWAEKVPGVRASNRAYTAYLNKLRADTFENLINKAKILNQTTGEFNMKQAGDIAKFINTATGRGSLGNLEKYATELNSTFFSPRLIASRLNMLNPMYYWSLSPYARKEAIKSLFAVAGAGTLISQLGKMAGGTVESDMTSSDAGKLKIGNTRIDPYAGFQQYIVLANRLAQNQTKSSVSGKTTELGKKYGSPTRLDILENFGESKLNPALSLAVGILKGKNVAGQLYNIPEEVAQRFVPLFLQDLKSVATENPNLIPGYSDLGLSNTDFSRGVLALPGAFGAGIQNYPSKTR